MHIQVELTNHCNLKCLECPHHMMKRTKVYMYDEVWDKVLEYVKHFKPETVIPHKDGEPLLHPKFNNYMSKLANVSPSSKIDIYTNGLLLDVPRILFLKSLSMRVVILVSFHFWSYQGDRINYDKVDQNLMECLREADGSKVSFVLVTHDISMSPKQELLDWQNKWKERSKEVKCLSENDIHINPNINPWTGLIESNHCVSFESCPYSDGKHFFIGSSGNVVACCMDLEERIKFGNIMVDNKGEIFKKRDVFYNKISKNVVEEELCRKCLNQDQS